MTRLINLGNFKINIVNDIRIGTGRPLEHAGLTGER